MVHRETGPRAHLLQPGGGGDGPIEQLGSEPAEHSDPHRAGPRDPPRLHRRARPRPDLGRLLADRAARAGAHGRRRGADRGVPRGQDIHDRTALQLFGPDSGLDPHLLRSRSKMVNYAVLYGKTSFTLAKDINVTQEAAQQFIDAYFAGFPRVRAFIDRTLEEARAHGRRADAGRTPPAGAQPDEPQLPDARAGRTRGREHADPGHGRRHPQARDDRRPRRARPRASAPRG